MAVTLHFHGTPITPLSVLYSLGGCCFCVSHAHPEQVAVVHQIGQAVLLDNGAYSAYTKGKPTNWPAYYAWCDRWLDYPTTSAIIPDAIDEPSQEQDALLNEWPHGHRGWPVWHTNEPVTRLLRLCDEWPKVAIGSTGEHWQVLGPSWRQRMDEAFNELAARHRRMPWLHMLRGMQLVLYDYPFASVDSTDVARNHNRPHNTARAMVDRWDAGNCPPRWTHREPNQERSLLEAS